MFITQVSPYGCIPRLFVSHCIFRQQAKGTKLLPLANSTVPRVTNISMQFRCNARRRVRDDVEDEDKFYGYNEEIAMLETYSQSCREEALIVTAIVDDEEVEVLVFKGFSSCLSGETAVDPARSVLPERALITKIDRVRGPFDPSQIHYIQQGMSFQEFKKSMIK